MKLIKLDAIDSTNSFLKDLARNSTLDNFTVVVAKNQTKGRGQQESVWFTESGKNLTFSLFVSSLQLNIHQQKYLNFAVSLAVFKTIKDLSFSNLSIKWPNDILAGNSKIAGILIENTFNHQQIKNTVIGIGLNVNQITFPYLNRNATSLKICLNKDFDLDKVLEQLLGQLKNQIDLLNKHQFDDLEAEYINCLYKKNVPTTFKDCKNVLFMGIIKGVSVDGKLQIQLENDSIKEFGVKEVSFA